MGLFHSSPEEKAEKNFLKLEKKAWQWPSLYYEEVLDVYIEGSMGIKKSAGKSPAYDIVKLPQFKNPEKAVELIRAATNPANIRKAKARFGGRGEGPGLKYHPFLALTTKDETERRNIVRSLILGKSPYLNKPLGYYICSKNLWELYCDSLEERLQVLYNIYTPAGKSDIICLAERYSDRSYGFEAWKWRELLENTKESVRQAIAERELDKLGSSDDPDVKARTKRFMDSKDNVLYERLQEISTFYMQVQKFEQDALDVQWIDEDGHKVEITDDLQIKKM